MVPNSISPHTFRSDNGTSVYIVVQDAPPSSSSSFSHHPTAHPLFRKMLLWAPFPPLISVRDHFYASAFSLPNPSLLTSPNHYALKQFSQLVSFSEHHLAHLDANSIALRVNSHAQLSISSHPTYLPQQTASQLLSSQPLQRSPRGSPNCPFRIPRPR